MGVLLILFLNLEFKKHIIQGIISAINQNNCEPMSD